MTCLKHIYDAQIAPLRPAPPGASSRSDNDAEESLSDPDVLARAAGATNGAKFQDLWHGRWEGSYKSQSEADFALINIIAFYTRSHTQIVRLFRQSALGSRDKADRDNYLNPMVWRALADRLPPIDFSRLTHNGVPVPMGVVSMASHPWISAAELRHKHFDPTVWIIPDVVPQGAILFGGRPKLGKSWAALQWAIAVAEGGATFGKQCEAGDVLYAALEDTLRRLKNRMWKMRGDEAWSPRLAFLCQLARADEGGVERVREWLRQAKNPRLVIIDTLAKVRPGKGREEGIYDADYRAVTAWKDLADEFNIAVVLVHHVRKLAADDPLEMISGTNGLTGAADAILILNRGNHGCTLGGRGRDLEEFELAIQFDANICQWSILGKASDVQRSSERQAIIGLLEQTAQPLSPKQIADSLGMSDDGVRQMLLRMTAAGEITKAARGLYATISHNSHDVTLV